MLAAQTLTGGKKIDAGTWVSDDRAIRYLQIGGNLVISTRTSGSVTIMDFSNGKLGINLSDESAPEAPPPPPPPPSPLQTSFNLSSKTDRQSYELANTIASNADLRIQNAATAINRGSDDAQAWRSYSFVRTGSGADVIEGGDINAISNVVYNAGAGNDRIYANTTISLVDAITRGDNPAHRGTQQQQLCARWWCG